MTDERAQELVSKLRASQVKASALNTTLMSTASTVKALADTLREIRRMADDAQIGSGERALEKVRELADKALDEQGVDHHTGE